MRLFYEWGGKQLQKYGEELCGDNVAFARHSDSVMLALSDGLGSGVKANILSILTTRIVMHLMENELSLGEVVETLSRTLPVCEVRKLAYSTFSIGKFFTEGHARVVEFDTPSVIMLRQRKSVSLPYEERNIEGKTIRELELELKVGDWLVFISDGVINAGIGGLYPLGWGTKQVSRFLEEHCHPDLSAQQLADKLAQAAWDLYCGEARRRCKCGRYKGPTQAYGHRLNRPTGGQEHRQKNRCQIYTASRFSGGLWWNDSTDCCPSSWR